MWCPDWPITRRFGALGSPPPETPFVLVERSGGRGLVVQAANRAARAVGVRLGQTHADARALCPGLESAAADPAEDAAALERLALWTERFSPSVATDRIAPRMDGLTLDVTGGAHLFGGEGALLAEIEGRLTRAAVPCRAALAETPGAAWALARFGPAEAPGRLVAPGGVRAALAPLPVEALRLAEPTIVLLKRFGLRRIGDLYPLPRAGLARRFRGETALQVVRRLDQALGIEAEALSCVRPAPVYRVWRGFAEPILLVEGVEHRLPELVRALAEQLARDGQGARRLALTAFRVDGRTTGIEVGFSAPAHAPAHLLRVLKDAGIEALDLGFGADALMLTAPAAEPVAARQDAMAGEEADRPDPNALPALIDRLQAKLGPAAVRRPTLRESWLPERSEALVRADRPTGVPARPGDPARYRPVLLLDPPEPVQDVVALTPDYPPRGFTWRRVRRRVVKAQGPERLSPEWWRTGLTPPEVDAARPALKVAREDVEHLARQATARQQGSRKVSKPGVCVPALPNATGLEGRRPALTLVAEPDPSDALPAGRTLDGYPPPKEVQAATSEPPPTAEAKPAEDRDYFLVEDEAGARFWLFRDGPHRPGDAAPAWWLHGVAA